MQGNEKGVNGSAEYGMLLAIFSVQGEEQSVFAGSPYGERVRG